MERPDWTRREFRVLRATRSRSVAVCSSTSTRVSRKVEVVWWMFGRGNMGSM